MEPPPCRVGVLVDPNVSGYSWVFKFGVGTFIRWKQPLRYLTELYVRDKATTGSFGREQPAPGLTVKHDIWGMAIMVLHEAGTSHDGTYMLCFTGTGHHYSSTKGLTHERANSVCTVRGPATTVFYCLHVRYLLPQLDFKPRYRLDGNKPPRYIAVMNVCSEFRHGRTLAGRLTLELLLPYFLFGSQPPSYYTFLRARFLVRDVSVLFEWEQAAAVVHAMFVWGHDNHGTIRREGATTILPRYDWYRNRPPQYRGGSVVVLVGERVPHSSGGVHCTQTVKNDSNDNHDNNYSINNTFKKQINTVNNNTEQQQ